MRSLIGIAGLAVISFVFSGSVWAQPSAAQVAAERHARAIVVHSNSGNRADYAKFVEANFSAEMLKMPIQRHLNFLSSLHDQNRGFEVKEVQDWGTNEAVLLVRSKLTGGWDGLLVRVEPTAPYKIAGIGLRPAKNAPAEARKLSNKEIAADLDSFVKKLADADVFSGSAASSKRSIAGHKTSSGQSWTVGSTSCRRVR